MRKIAPRNAQFSRRTKKRPGASREESRGEISIARTIDHDLICCTDTGFTSGPRLDDGETRGPCISDGNGVYRYATVRYGSTSALSIHDLPIHDHNERESREETRAAVRRERSCRAPLEGNGGRVRETRATMRTRRRSTDSLYSRIGTGQRWKRRGPIIWAVSCGTQ